MTDVAYSARRHALAPGRLEAKLSELRQIAATRPPDARLETWARQHLAIEPEALPQWCRRAWWGLAAGELVRAYLYDQDRHAEALALADSSQWHLIDEAARHGGVILAAAHIGPPKYAMNHVLNRCIQPLIWTNTGDMPAWLPQAPLTLMDPLKAKDRAELLVKSALHLRRNGVVFGAPDGAFSSRHIAIDDCRKRWLFSPGLPMLARHLDVQAFALTALWRQDRIHLAVQPLAAPRPDLAGDAWARAWIENYWHTVMAPVIAGSPENLRFLLQIDTHNYREEFET